MFVFLEFFQQGAFAQFFQVAGFVGVGDVPAVFGFADQCGVSFGQVAHFFPIGGEVGMDLFGYVAFAVVAEEVLVEEFTQIKLGFVFAPAAELLHELRVDVGEGLRFGFEELAQPLDGGGFVGDEQGDLFDLSGGHFYAVVFGGLFGEEVHAVTVDEALG